MATAARQELTSATRRYAHIVDESIPAPSIAAMHRMEEVDELNYLSHILIRMFEVEGEAGEKRFSLR